MKKYLSMKIQIIIAGTLLIALGAIVLICFGLAGRSVTAEAATVLYSGTSGDLDWSISSDGVLTISGSGDYEMDYVDDPEYDLPGWLEYRDSITSATVSVTDITYTGYMFYGCAKLVDIDLSELDTSNVTFMGYMFMSCVKLTSIDVSNFDTSKVTNMADMFYECSSLKTLEVGGFNTSKVTNMCGMFEECNSLSSLDVSGFVTSNVTNMISMFNGCESLTSLDVSGFNTSKITSLKNMFSDCSSLTALDVSGFRTDNVTDMENLFSGCSSLKSLDVSGFDTSKVTNMRCIFYNCSSLTGIDVGNFDTSNVETMTSMFSGCSGLTSLDVSSFDTSSATGMAYMFNKCSSLTKLDLSSFDTSNVDTMEYMFSQCTKLTDLNIDSFDTANVANMSWMFYACFSLTSLDLGGFDMSGLTSEGCVESMFYACNGLENLIMPAGVPYAVILPYESEEEQNDSYYWTDQNGAVCTHTRAGLSTGMTYTRYQEEEETTAEVTTSNRETETEQTTIQEETSEPSEEKSTDIDLEVPALTGAVNTDRGVRVNWEAVSDATGYLIYRQLDEGEWVVLDETTSTSYLDTSADSGSTYSYIIYAVTVDGNQEVQSEGEAGKTTVRLETPAVTEAVNEASGKMEICWSSVRNAEGYQVQYSEDAFFAGGMVTLTIRDSSILSRKIVSLTAGSTYYVRVRAYCTTESGAKYFSAWSSVEEVLINSED